MLADIGATCATMEECYELMLAYAAQGLPTDEGAAGDLPVRACLTRAAGTLIGLIEDLESRACGSDLDDALPFLVVLQNDARASLAAIELVLAQPAISSQLADNLNASTHVRALLTDLFLLSEIEAAKRARPLVVLGSQGTAQRRADR